MSFKEIKSKKEQKTYTSENFDELVNDIEKYDFAVIYNSDSVKILKKDDIEALDKEKFLEVRAFSQNEELHIIEINGEYTGRIITDDAGDCVEIVDEEHLLWGNKTKKDGDYTILSEDRGTELRLPLEVKTGQRAFIKVRNYLNPEEDTFEFNDWRMVDFFAKEAKEYGIYEE
jgi:CRISPR-associated protein (TIGR03984 family)